MLRIPADTFRLFVTSGIVNARFGTLVAAVHTLAIAVLGTCAATGTLAISGRKLFRFGVATLLMTASAMAASRALLQVTTRQPYVEDTMLTERGLLRDRGSAQVFTSHHDVVPPPAVTGSVLERIRQRGILRVGYLPDSLPYVFFNRRNELVGFDVEMALQLARDLGVEAEFVPVRRTIFESGLESAECDTVMSGVTITADRSMQVRFSSSYLDETVAFVVPDERAAAFSDWSSVRAMGRFRLGVPRAPYFMQKIRDELTDVEIVPIDRVEDMFGASRTPIDAALATAERGSAYTLLHPQYSVAVPKPRPFKVPLAYVIADRDAALTSVVNTWVELKTKDGPIDQLFAYWILGQDSKPKARRWSIGGDILHWW
jgi:ABC-type amino acid transport substrate-binding protein